MCIIIIARNVITRTVMHRKHRQPADPRPHPCHSRLHQSQSQFPCFSCTEGKLSLAGAATSIIFVATNTFVATKDDKTFITTNTCFCRDKHNFVATNIILSQQKFGRDKHAFVATKDVFCRDKHAAKRLSRQKRYLWQLPPMIENNSWLWAVRRFQGRWRNGRRHRGDRQISRRLERVL